MPDEEQRPDEHQLGSPLTTNVSPQEYCILLTSRRALERLPSIKTDVPALLDRLTGMTYVLAVPAT